jgi:hypothetical protein
MEQQSMGQQKQPLTWNTEASEQRIAAHRIQPGIRPTLAPFSRFMRSRPRPFPAPKPFLASSTSPLIHFLLLRLSAFEAFPVPVPYPGKSNFPGRIR